MQELLSVSDLLPEEPQPTISRRYTLDKMPSICPHCGQQCIRQDILRLWYCGLCGAYQERKETVKLALTKEMLKPEAISTMIDFVCANCGAPDRKGKKAKRTLCQKCETARINGNRKRGITLVTALKTYVCAKCNRAIHVGTKHYTDTRSKYMRVRWHEQCYKQ